MVMNHMQQWRKNKKAYELRTVTVGCFVAPRPAPILNWRCSFKSAFKKGEVGAMSCQSEWPKLKQGGYLDNKAYLASAI